LVLRTRFFVETTLCRIKPEKINVENSEDLGLGFEKFILFKTIFVNFIIDISNNI
jgi:hypothetical protein